MKQNLINLKTIKTLTEYMKSQKVQSFKITAKGIEVVFEPDTMLVKSLDIADVDSKEKEDLSKSVSDLQELLYSARR